MLKTQALLSTGEAAPSGSVPHSEPIVSTVRHVTGTGSGLLGGIPRVVVQISALPKRATVGVRAPYATRRKLRYEANQVWMNTTFILQGPQSSGILAVET